MKIQQVPIAKLTPYAFNNKKHDASQIGAIMESIKEFGFVQPIVADKDLVIIIGHARTEAAKRLSLTDVPVIVMENLTDIQTKRLRLLDNRLSDLGEYDLDNIKLELEAIGDDNLTALFEGLEGLEMDAETTSAEKEIEEDDVPAVRTAEFVKRGDVFLLGAHRLMCGDSTSPEDIATLTGGGVADMVFTDPPYNVNYKGQGKNTKNDHMTPEQFEVFLDAVFARYRETLKETGGMYVFHSTSTQAQFESNIRKHGFEIRNQLIWNKPMAALGWGDYRWKHEPFFYCSVAGKSPNFYGDRTHSTVIESEKSDQKILEAIKHTREAEKQGTTTIWSMRRDNVNEYVHPTQKPVELIGYAIENSSARGDTVLDLFGGSGSTLIACEKHGRKCLTMELDEAYVETIIKRYKKYTDGATVACENRKISHPFISA